MQLIEYDDIAKLFTLDLKDKTFDQLCLNAAYTELEKYIGYTLEEKEYSEVQTVKDNRIILNAINIIEVIEIKDLETKKIIDFFTVDYENKSIYFIPAKTNDHIIFINYKAGFTKETLPADLKEAIIKLFFLKQKTLNKLNNNETEETKEALPAEIKDTINHYTRKHL